MKLCIILGHSWKPTATNFMGIPLERKCRFCGRYQEARYSDGGKWYDIDAKDAFANKEATNG